MGPVLRGEEISSSESSNMASISSSSESSSFPLGGGLLSNSGDLAVGGVFEMNSDLARSGLAGLGGLSFAENVAIFSTGCLGELDIGVRENGLAVGVIPMKYRPVVSVANIAFRE